MKIIKNILKTAAAGIVAVGILCIILAVYYLQPVHISNPYGNTDYIWQPGSVWCKMTEGISWGKIDEAGYNNPEVIENPDILLLGSSHMEAMNVMQHQSTAAVLTQALNEEFTVYNKGISGHNFMKICYYLPYNLDLYSTVPEYVVLETDTLTFTDSKIESVLNGTIEKTVSYDTGLIAAVQKMPFFSALYHQIQGGLIDLLVPDMDKLTNLFVPDKTLSVIPSATFKQSTPVTKEHTAYERLFEYLADVQQEYETQLIICYHPSGKLQTDGTNKWTNEDIKPEFIQMCNDAGIIFADMTETFENMYLQENKLPYGFVTGAVNSGHLNKNGHKAIGTKLAEVIREMEAE